jgi:hypothetical protein
MVWFAVKGGKNMGPVNAFSVSNTSTLYQAGSGTGPNGELINFNTAAYNVGTTFSLTNDVTTPPYSGASFTFSYSIPVYNAGASALTFDVAIYTVSSGLPVSRISGTSITTSGLAASTSTTVSFSGTATSSGTTTFGLFVWVTTGSYSVRIGGTSYYGTPTWTLNYS